MKTAEELRHIRQEAISIALEKAMETKLVEKAEKGHGKVCFYKEDFPTMMEDDWRRLPLSFWNGIRQILENAGYRCNRLYKVFWSDYSSTWIETDDWSSKDYRYYEDGIAVYLD